MAIDYDKAMRPNLYELMQGGGGGSYELPTASADVLGGVKIGSNMVMTDGVLTADTFTKGEIEEQHAELQSLINGISDKIIETDIQFVTTPSGARCSWRTFTINKLLHLAYGYAPALTASIVHQVGQIYRSDIISISTPTTYGDYRATTIFQNAVVTKPGYGVWAVMNSYTQSKIEFQLMSSSNRGSEVTYPTWLFCAYFLMPPLE